MPQRLTFDEFLALPAEEPALELEPDGVVVQNVSPHGKRRSWVNSRTQLAPLRHEYNRLNTGDGAPGSGMHSVSFQTAENNLHLTDGIPPAVLLQINEALLLQIKEASAPVATPFHSIVRGGRHAGCVYRSTI